MWLSFFCSMTSFVAGFAVFSILGNMAHITGKNVSEVVASGDFHAKMFLVLSDFSMCEEPVTISLTTAAT